MEVNYTNARAEILPPFRLPAKNQLSQALCLAVKQIFLETYLYWLKKASIMRLLNNLPDFMK